MRARISGGKIPLAIGGRWLGQSPWQLHKEKWTCVETEETEEAAVAIPRQTPARPDSKRPELLSGRRLPPRARSRALPRLEPRSVRLRDRW